jgi:hypothetical protein
MYSRTLGLVAAASLVLIACGGDDGDTGPQCMVTGEMSTPGQPNDPCPQDNAACVAANGKAYAKCGADMRWAKTCDCIPQGSMTGTISMPSAQTPVMSTCGDTVITAPAEKCDRTNLNGATCQSLGFAGGGMLLCNPTTCNYDTIMCRNTTGTGTAGTSGGAGMGGGGTGS